MKRRFSKGEASGLNVSSKISGSTSAGFGASMIDVQVIPRKNSPNSREKRREYKKSVMYEQLILKLRND